nr:hypothetical protein [Tanacetum cinerariifolium]
KAIEEKKNPKVARALAPFPIIIHNGECLSMLIYMPGMKSNHVNVTVEDNMLLCKGTRPDGKPATHVPHYTPNYSFPTIDGKQRTSYVPNYIPVSLLPKKPYTDVDLEVEHEQQYGTYACYIKLPNKTYTPSDVEAKMKDCVVLVTFNNVAREDVAPFI